MVDERWGVQLLLLILSLSLSATQQSLHHPVKGGQSKHGGSRANTEAACVVVVVAAVVGAACVCGDCCWDKVLFKCL